MLFCYLEYDWKDGLFGMLFCMENLGSSYAFGNRKGWEKDPCCYLVRLFYRSCMRRVSYDAVDSEPFLWENVLKEGTYVYMQLFTKKYYADRDLLCLAYDRRGDRENRSKYRLPFVLDIGNILGGLCDDDDDFNNEDNLSDIDEVWRYHRYLIREVEDPRNESKPRTYPSFSTLYSSDNGNPFLTLYERGFLLYSPALMVKLGNFGFTKKLADGLWEQDEPEMDFKLLFSTYDQFFNTLKSMYKNWKIPDFYRTRKWKIGKKHQEIYNSVCREYPNFFRHWLNLRDEYDGKVADFERNFDWPYQFCVENEKIDSFLREGDSSFYKACSHSQKQFVVTRNFLKMSLHHLRNFWKLQLMYEYTHSKNEEGLNSEVREAPRNYMTNLGIEMKRLTKFSMREIVASGERMPGEKKINN